MNIINNIDNSEVINLGQDLKVEVYFDDNSGLLTATVSKVEIKSTEDWIDFYFAIPAVDDCGELTFGHPFGSYLQREPTNKTDVGVLSYFEMEWEDVDEDGFPYIQDHWEMWGMNPNGNPLWFLPDGFRQEDNVDLGKKVKDLIFTIAKAYGDYLTKEVTK